MHQNKTFESLENPQKTQKVRFPKIFRKKIRSKKCRTAVKNQGSAIKSFFLIFEFGVQLVELSDFKNNKIRRIR